MDWTNWPYLVLTLLCLAYSGSCAWKDYTKDRDLRREYGFSRAELKLARENGEVPW